MTEPTCQGKQLSREKSAVSFESTGLTSRTCKSPLYNEAYWTITFCLASNCGTLNPRTNSSVTDTLLSNTRMPIKSRPSF